MNAQSKIRKNKNVVQNVACIVAHPDDELLGVGGTLLSHIARKDLVYVIILSDGEGAKRLKKEMNPERRIIAQKCADLSGYVLFKHYNFPDQKFDTLPRLDIIKCLEKDLSKIKPDIVYTHHPGDLNLDHQITAKSTLTVLRPMGVIKTCNSIFSFETPSSTDQVVQLNPFTFIPNHYINIQKYWKKKISLLKLYEKELKSNPHPRSIKSINALSIKRGAESGLKRAEAFSLIRKVIF